MTQISQATETEQGEAPEEMDAMGNAFDQVRSLEDRLAGAWEMPVRFVLLTGDGKERQRQLKKQLRGNRRGARLSVKFAFRGAWFEMKHGLRKRWDDLRDGERR